MTSKQQQPEVKEEKSPGKFHFPTSGNPEQGKVEKARPTEQPASLRHQLGGQDGLSVAQVQLGPPM